VLHESQAVFEGSHDYHMIVQGGSFADIPK